MRSVLVLVVLAGLLSGACSSGDEDTASDTTARTEDAGAGGESCAGEVESPDTRFIVDACGRVVILRGVNVEASAKGEVQADRHLPATDVDDQATLATWGWNTVRFLVFWGAIEPEPGKYDEAYLDEVQTWLDWYADHGVHVVLDMHQDLYGWLVNGNGAPDWAVDTGGLTVKPIEEGQPWFLQGADPAVQAAYQSFWNPSDGDTRLQDHYMDTLAQLVERFADHPAVIGFDVMNEPSFANGDLAATLAIQGDAAAGRFVNENLTDFMNRGIEAVRSVDQNTWVFIQPTSLLNAFPYAGDLTEADITDPRDGPPRIVYAGHLYEQSVHDGGGYAEDSTYVETWRGLRTAEAAELNAALWIGEWGGTPDQDRMGEYIAEVTTMADEEMVGWAWWSWDPGGWSPVEGDGETPSANGEDLLRVQPRAIAGTPSAFSWDAAGSVFEMSWEERADAVGDTEIAVPARLFGDGIEVVLDGEPLGAPSWDEETSVLSVSPDRSAATHEVCVAPSGSGRCGP